MSPKMQSMVMGGLVGGLLLVLSAFFGQSSQIVSGIMCCVAGIAGPLLASWHYTSNSELTMSSGQGAGLGAVVGSISALISTIFNYALQAAGILPTQEEGIEMARRTMEEQGMSAEQIEQNLQFAEMFSSPVLAIGVGLVMMVVIGAIGGIIGAAMFKHGRGEEGVA